MHQLRPRLNRVNGTGGHPTAGGFGARCGLSEEWGCPDAAASRAGVWGRGDRRRTARGDNGAAGSKTGLSRELEGAEGSPSQHGCPAKVNRGF